MIKTIIIHKYIRFFEKLLFVHLKTKLKENIEKKNVYSLKHLTLYTFRKCT